MKVFVFCERCIKEILRDPINLFFCFGFLIALLLLLSAIQANIPADLFNIETLTPGISVFGLSFLTLFSASLIAKDRESLFLERLYTTPLTSIEFILGYILSMLPIAFIQSIACYLIAILLGLPITINILFAILLLLPIAIFNISFGLLCGSLFNVKQVGGICGALFTNLSGWLSGIWFDLNLVGGVFLFVAKVLPFYHSVEAVKCCILGEYSNIPIHILIVSIYALCMCVGASIMFLRQMKK